MRAASARVALLHALSPAPAAVRPGLPFVTEEVWSWWHDGSVHVTSWPTRLELGDTSPLPDLAAISDVLVAVRRAKTEAKSSQRAPVSRLTVRAPEAALLVAAQPDLIDTLTVGELVLEQRDGPVEVSVELG